MINSIIKVINGNAGVIDFLYFGIALVIAYAVVKVIIYCFKK